MKDTNEFGMEWQVLASEPMLFRELGEVQPPMKCVMPEASTSSKKRRLGEALVSEQDAASACAHVAKGDHDSCIFDGTPTRGTSMLLFFVYTNDEASLTHLLLLVLQIACTLSRSIGNQ